MPQSRTVLRMSLACAILWCPVWAGADQMAVPTGFVPFTPRQSFKTVSDLTEQELLDQLARPTWVLAPIPPSADSLAIRAPWHHPAVSELAARGRSSAAARGRIVPALLRMYNDSTAADDAGSADERFHAALALALLNETSGFAELDRVFVDPHQRVEQRTAAIFGLAGRPDRLDPAALRALLEGWLPAAVPGSAVSAGRPHSASPGRDRGNERPLQAQELVAGTLWAMIRAQQTRGEHNPAADPLLLRAAGSGGVLVRQVAATAFVGQKWDKPPDLLGDLLRDPAPAVRQTALAAVAARPNVAGAPLILSATHDADLAVRLNAIGHLTRCGKELAVPRLQELLRSSSAAERSAAVGAAGRFGIWGSVQAAVADESHEVRAAAAEALAAMPGENAVALLRRLVTDRSTLVQSAAVDALAKRPGPEAVTGLLEALDSPTLQTRQRAWDLLRARWAPATAFPVHAPPSERADRLNDLRRQWRSQLASGRYSAKVLEAAVPTPNHNQPAAPAAADRSAADERLERQVAQRVTDWHRHDSNMRPRIAQQIIALGPGSVPYIEAVFEAHNSYPEPDFLRTVLSELDPVYRGLALLWEPAVAGTHAADALARELGQRPLTRMQAAVIAERLRTAIESGLWIELAGRLEREAPQEAAALDAVALAHPEPAVRLDACKRVARRLEPRHADLLVRLFADPQLGIRRCALRAAGGTKEAALIPPLRRALVTPDARTRLAAAASLCELGDADAALELERLAGHPDHQLRRAALEEIVHARLLDHSRSLRVFRRSLDDPRLEVQRLALAGLEQRLGAQALRPSPTPGVPLAEQVAAWKRLLDAKASPLLAN